MGTSEEIAVDFINRYKEILRNTDYEITEFGELIVIKGKKKIILTNFVFYPVEIIREVSNEREDKIRYVFEGILKGEKILPRIEISEADLANSKWIGKWSSFCRILPKEKENYNFLLDMIFLFEKNTNEIIEFQSIGWNKYKGKWLFLYSGRDKIINTLEKKYSVRTVHKDFSMIFNSSTEEIIAYKKAIDILNFFDKKLTLSLFSFLLTSLLTTPLSKFKDMTPSFSLWIYGKSGTGKTTFAELFSKVFDKQNMIRVDAYKNKLKEAGKIYKDSVLIVDDFGTDKTRDSEKNTLLKIENLIRLLSDRTNSLDTDQIPQGLLLFTGERFLEINEENHSTVSRLLRIKMDNIFNSSLEGYSYDKIERFNEYKNEKYLQTSIYYYLDWLEFKVNNGLIDDYKTDFNKIRNEIKTNIHARYLDSIAHLITSFNFYLSYGQDKGFITPEQYMELGSTTRNIFLAILEDQKKAVPDPRIEEFIRIFKVLLTSGKVKIIEKGSLTYPPILNKDKNIYGILDTESNILKLHWQPILTMLDEYTGNSNYPTSSFVAHSKTFGKLLVQHRMVKTHEYQSRNNITTPSVTIENSIKVKCRVIDFHTEKIPDIVNLIKELNPPIVLNSDSFIQEQAPKRGKKKAHTFLIDGVENKFIK
ncbi:hypothetical protein [Mesobacillus jeotgali]|uniref:Helicase superfamily 3 single-stranded DNA/RNA virus domain-containing protein n=1 Tax=Mesobacillus jeotgali TaxID=129985 RepID=A0ABY9VHZ8_9BACI|nr:hypothetical protein [Mesobacillus jeotgali]WNF21332.1 hypothetical protein RH061_14120 [Mesobacillus jeotgali]